ncbi:hypothetical protein [Sphingomonas sp. TREG-RG-20F-R18-01]|uniref:hypothetical protein n=2 Tax=unclassified Sphingomonas TaxID=196159 RepID=UPI001F56B339|nr:hypothetical protein [Sphingomonas sp. TREG-RG-20F-R18-01]
MPYSRMSAALKIARDRKLLPRQFELSWDDWEDFTAATHGLQSVSGYPQTWKFAGVHVRRSIDKYAVSTLSADGDDAPIELNQASRTVYRYVPGHLQS